ncbi:MAG TPA: hypothetical protein PKE69_20005 [Pyrinomonadaceae bacterium]|nr:hypothetical protein [Pyrinomonadaceae bacterium]
MNRKSKRKTLKVFIILALLTTISSCHTLSESLEPGEDKNLKAVKREKPNLSDESGKVTVDPDSDKLTEEKNAPVNKPVADKTQTTETKKTETETTETEKKETESAKCSPASTQKIDISWVNETGRTLQIQWIGFDCNEKSYKSIEPGETFEQSTFVGHIWNIYAINESNKGQKKLYKTVTVSESNKNMIFEDDQPSDDPDILN